MVPDRGAGNPVEKPGKSKTPHGTLRNPVYSPQGVLWGVSEGKGGTKLYQKALSASTNQPSSQRWSAREGEQHPSSLHEHLYPESFLKTVSNDEEPGSETIMCRLERGPRRTQQLPSPHELLATEGGGSISVFTIEH